MTAKQIRLQVDAGTLAAATAKLTEGQTLVSVVETALAGFATGDAPAPVVTSDLDALCDAIQHHVEGQPGGYGKEAGPQEVQLYFNAGREQAKRWRCSYVAAINGTRRSWKQTHGATPLEALTAARTAQTAPPKATPEPKAPAEPKVAAKTAKATAAPEAPETPEVPDAKATPEPATA